ncbi:MAG: hypothetical protein ACE5JG_06635 [Planctomycetota bacterium]
MARAFPVLLLVVAAGCGSDPDPVAVEQPGRYARPDFAKLWREMEVPSGDDWRGAGNPIQKIAPPGAYQALWKSVERAEEAGLFELYGFESANTNEGDYEALLFVRTAEGVTCLSANGDFHDSRPDRNTVPAHAVSAEAYARLRTRVAVEVPFPIVSSMTSRVEDGSWYLFHVYREGKSHAALWYEPWEEAERTREGLADFGKRQPVLAMRGALWAAAPPELFPRDDPGPEGDIPDDELWQFDRLEVYGRAPGYRPAPAKR